MTIDPRRVAGRLVNTLPVLQAGKCKKVKTPAEKQEQTRAERRSSMTWAPKYGKDS